MKLIFWSLVDDILIDFIDANKSLQDLSKKHEFYAMCSGKKSAKIVSKFYNAKIINSINDVRLKGKTILGEVKKRNDYDALVKIDLDAIVINENFLFKRIEENIKPLSIIGNLRDAINSWGIMYIRGGCWAMHKTAVDKIVFKYGRRNSGFDRPFNESVIRSHISQIDCKLFEMRGSYSGEFPVWHPNKVNGVSLPNKQKLMLFNSIINKHYVN